jgi:hypothetical protein
MTQLQQHTVPAPEFGDDFSLQMGWNDLSVLEEYFHQKRPEERWWANAVDSLDACEYSSVKAIVDQCLRNPEGKRVPEDAITWPDVPLVEIAWKCLDLLAVRVFGKPYKTLIAELVDQAVDPLDKIPDLPIESTVGAGTT